MLGHHWEDNRLIGYTEDENEMCSVNYFVFRFILHLAITNKIPQDTLEHETELLIHSYGAHIATPNDHWPSEAVLASMNQSRLFNNQLNMSYSITSRNNTFIPFFAEKMNEFIQNQINSQQVGMLAFDITATAAFCVFVLLAVLTIGFAVMRLRQNRNKNTDGETIPLNQASTKAQLGN